ncbi:MAG: nascent polypeptide-associated complex protein [archaeon]
MMNLDPKKMQGMMKQLGIKQEEIEAKRVIIEQEDKNIIIEPASVTKIKMQGQESWQIVGEAKEEEKQEDNSEDIKAVMEKTSCTEEEAKKALENSNGDLAEAILSLS